MRANVSENTYSSCCNHHNTLTATREVCDEREHRECDVGGNPSELEEEDGRAAVTGYVATRRHVVCVQRLLFRTKDAGAERPSGCGAMQTLETKSESGEGDDIADEGATFKGMIPIEYVA
jgi:hypothetical protein